MKKNEITVTMSTIKAELLIASYITKEALFLDWLFKDLGINPN